MNFSLFHKLAPLQMFCKRQSRWLDLVSTDREPSRFNLYCPLSRIIYAWADRGIYLQAYSPVRGISGKAEIQKLANNALRELL